jgi:hypothetical protein
VYLLGWTADFIIFQIWFDGITALGAMLAFQILAFARKGGKPFEVPPGIPTSSLPPVLVAVWLVLLLVLGIPYWFTLFFFGVEVFEDGFLVNLLQDTSLLIALLLALASNAIEESRRGYEQMNEKEIRLEFNWEFSMHLARISALILVTFVLRLGLIVGLALALSYIEIYPMRALRFLGGDKTLETDNQNQSRD